MVGAAPTTDSMLEKFLLKCEKTKDQIKLLQGMKLDLLVNRLQL